jgi:hypothetical protein
MKIARFSALHHMTIVFGLVTLAARMNAQSPPLFHFEPKPGDYRVGLRVVEQYDYTRVFHSAVDPLGKSYAGERARPLQTLVWYPAETSASAKQMTVKDYVDLLPTETDFNHPYVLANWKEFVDEGMKATFPSQMLSVRDAKAVSGRFPVVIYAPSLSAMSWENADLCEYLASHGYVVIASPDFGTKSQTMSIDLDGIATETGDLEFLIGYAQTLSNTDMSKLSVAAFSWGGMSNLFAAARDSRIRAMVELDSSLRYFPGLVNGEQSIERTETAYRGIQGMSGPSVLNAWTHGDLITVNMLGMVHGEFSSMFQRSESFWKTYPRVSVADYSRQDGIAGYAWVARYVLAFLDSYMKGDAAGTSFLKNTPAENGAPVHFISVTYRKAQGLAPTLDTLKLEAGKQGFDRLDNIYAAMKKDSSDFNLDATEMRAWAADLITSGHLREAICVLKLNVELYPNGVTGYNPLIALGDAYAQAGQKDLAIQSYKTQLEKTPGNDAVAEKLKALSQ